MPVASLEDYPDNIRHFSIYDEVETAARLIRLGLGALQDEDTYRSFLNLPLLALSNGFERLLKVIICFAYREEHGHYPPLSEIKGHRLDFLLEKVLPLFTDEYLKRPAVRTDFELLTSHPLLKDILSILSDFGATERYFHLNIVVGEPVKSVSSPDDQWGLKIEMAILKDNPDWYAELSVPRNTVPQKIATEVIVLLERFTRALGRLFTLRGIGEEAGASSSFLMDFVELRDANLGKRRYQLDGKQEHD